MKLAIMQPYFLPYIGYWQLINAVDTFVIYDNVQYVKRGWINRNRFLQNGADALFTIPLKKDPQLLNINERIISETFDRNKLLRQFTTAYAKAPYYSEIMPIISNLVNNESHGLLEYISNAVITLCQYLGINTTLINASSIGVDHGLKAENKIMAICKIMQTDTYVNAIGGETLYSKEWFQSQGIDLKFIKSRNIEYQQFSNDFIPWLSILDVLMFNSKDTVKGMLTNYELI